MERSSNRVSTSVQRGDRSFTAQVGTTMGGKQRLGLLSLIFTAFSSCCSFSSTTDCSTISDTQCRVLCELFVATGGDRWNGDGLIHLSGAWGDGTAPCALSAYWSGIRACPMVRQSAGVRQSEKPDSTLTTRRTHCSAHCLRVGCLTVSAII